MGEVQQLFGCATSGTANELGSFGLEQGFCCPEESPGDWLSHFSSKELSIWVAFPFSFSSLPVEEDH